MHRLETASGSQQVPKRSIDSPPPPSSSAKIPRTAAECGEEGGESHPEGMEAIPGTQRYLLAVEYAGTRFFGAQKQPNCRTVVGSLEGKLRNRLIKRRGVVRFSRINLEAFRKFIGQSVSISCSSRTDAGVHALSNTFHVDVVRTSKRKPGEVLPPHEAGVVRRAVNHFLQKNEGDIMVIDVRCVPADFHARFKALERTYFYRILSGPEPLSVFDREGAWHVCEELDILAMRKACNVLVGCHDFSSFRAAGCQAKSPIKTLDELQVSEVTPSPYFPSSVERARPTSLEEPLVHEIECGIPSHNLNVVQADLRKCSTTSSEHFGQRRLHRCFVITARARSFLYHQVRLIVGVLKSVGTGDLTVNDVERILNAKTVTASGPMAPACGLYLGSVKYDLP